MTYLQKKSTSIAPIMQTLGDLTMRRRRKVDLFVWEITALLAINRMETLLPLQLDFQAAERTLPYRPVDLSTSQQWAMLPRVPPLGRKVGQMRQFLLFTICPSPFRTRACLTNPRARWVLHQLVPTRYPPDHRTLAECGILDIAARHHLRL